MNKISFFEKEFYLNFLREVVPIDFFFTFGLERFKTGILALILHI